MSWKSWVDWSPRNWDLSGGSAVLVATFSSHYGCSADCLNDDARTCCLRIGGLIFLHFCITKLAEEKQQERINLSTFH